MKTECPMLQMLERRYFHLAGKERMGRTRGITEVVDKLEGIIRDLRQQPSTPVPVECLPPPPTFTDNNR